MNFKKVSKFAAGLKWGCRTNSLTNPDLYIVAKYKVGMQNLLAFSFQ